MNEPDPFQRQKEALYRYARYLKRVPTLEEALDYLHDNKLFSSPWQENLARRMAKVRSILTFIALTFDPGKCAKGSVNVGKYDEWARNKFPNGLTGGKLRYLTEEGEVFEADQDINVSAAFIGVFLAVCEFALLIDKNQDDSLPHRRAKEIWEALYAKGLVPLPFSDRKWAVCRDELEKQGIIRVTDRNYCTGKAMKWAVGKFFPFLGLWKGRKVCSLKGPCCLPREKETTTQEHNTLLHRQPAKTGPEALGIPARPPP